MTANLPVATEIVPIVLQLQPAIAMTDDQFYEFCQLNRDFRIERNAAGELIIMPPTGSETDQCNFDIIVQLGIWTKQDGTGVGFGSSGGFTLPNGAVRVTRCSLDKTHTLGSDTTRTAEKICADLS